MRKITILIADHDAQILHLATRNLQMEGYQTLTATNSREALEHIGVKMPDLLLLDVLPTVDGFTICQRVREFSRVPVVIITARGRDHDKVRGFDLGADDYLMKPFSVADLLTRVRAVLRRAEYAVEQVGVSPAQFTVCDVTLDFAQHLVLRGGNDVDLTPLEYQICAYLMQNAGRVLTQNMLLEHVWGAEYSGEYHLLQVNINRLRRKLELDPAHPRYIMTKPGVGYLFAQA